MRPIDFAEANMVFHGPGYVDLPGHLDDEISTFCWKLTPQEIAEIVITGKIWHQVMTFNNSLQPQRLSATKPVF